MPVKAMTSNGDGTITLMNSVYLSFKLIQAYAFFPLKQSLSLAEKERQECLIRIPLDFLKGIIKQNKLGHCYNFSWKDKLISFLLL